MENILGRRKYWYNRVFICLELVKCLQHKELAFIMAKGEERKFQVRFLLAETYDMFKKHTEALGFSDKMWNVYRSLSTLKPNSIPVSSYNILRRLDDPKYQEFKNNYHKYMQDYDFLLDLDGKDFGDAWHQAKQIKEVLDEFSLPYAIWNSSAKGFHFWIDGKYFPDIKVFDKPVTFGAVASNIKGIYSLEGLDTSIYDFKRVAKVPYSFNCADNTVILPLDDEIFNIKFKQYLDRYLTSNSVLSRIMLKNRGLLVRNLNLEEEKLKENCKKFINEFKG